MYKFLAMVSTVLLGCSYRLHYISDVFVQLLHRSVMVLYNELMCLVHLAISVFMHFERPLTRAHRYATLPTCGRSQVHSLFSELFNFLDLFRQIFDWCVRVQKSSWNVRILWSAANKGWEKEALIFLVCLQLGLLEFGVGLAATSPRLWGILPLLARWDLLRNLTQVNELLRFISLLVCFIM